MAANDHEAEAEVEAQLNGIRNATAWLNGNTAHAYRRAASQGLHAPQCIVRDYHLQTAEQLIRVELKRAEQVLGAKNCCSSYLRASLSSTLNGQNR